MSRLRLIVFACKGRLCLFLRLPDGRRLLVDCAPRPDGTPLAWLRRRGEISPLAPLTQYLCPALRPDPRAWLAVISLVRGLVLRPGGSWVVWEPQAQRDEPGFALQARVIPLGGLPPTPPQAECPPLLVMGLPPAEVLSLAGPPAAWVANSSLALLWPCPGGDFLLGGDLRPAAWQRLLAQPRLGSALSGVALYAAGEPAGGYEQGYDLERALVMAALPWLVLGAAWGDHGSLSPRRALATPPLAELRVDVASDGLMQVRGRPGVEPRLSWQGLVRPVSDPLLPAPWPLRRALAGRCHE